MIGPSGEPSKAMKKPPKTMAMWRTTIRPYGAAICRITVTVRYSPLPTKLTQNETR
jgi:hypothetical protein